MKKPVLKQKNLKNCSFDFKNNDPSKKAGANYLRIQRESKDYMVTSPEVKLSITEAKALYGFLSESLESK
ncbi:hypothetical protein N9W84_00890 [bacterium]|nr:hypothetical protein [bacterium]